MAESRITLALLVVASLVVATSIVLDRFPEMTADLLARVADRESRSVGSSHEMEGMKMKETTQ
jgi:hypothetical protein